VERRASHKTSVGDKMAILPMLLREIDFSDGVFEKYKNWLWQEKHNGERVLVHIKDGKVSAMRNRNDNPVLHRFPELNSVSFPNVKSAILDCEIIVEEDVYIDINTGSIYTEEEVVNGKDEFEIVQDVQKKA
jgi:ATP-dependent DNA ligase